MDEGWPVVSVPALAAWLPDDRCRVVDCRFDLQDPGAGRRAWIAGHVPGAAFLDLDMDLSGPVTATSGRHPLPDPGQLAAAFGRAGIGHDTKVVFYDSGPGAFAARAWWLLRWLGNDDAWLLDGGIGAWEAAGMPVETGDVPAVAADFRWHSTHDERLITTAEILGKGAAALRIVDARDASRFAGDAEPIDRVAGHIPGARNLPIDESLTASANWKSPEALRALWERVLPGIDDGARWTAMCGSGVTACHLAVSALRAGLPEPGIYVGSWSEWIRDPSRPVATGHGVESEADDGAESA